MIYPIAEMFDSWQGEGMFAGQRQHFIRLAGCSVGKYIPLPQLQDTLPSLALFREAYPKHSICTNVFGESFLCDTDYHGILKLDAAGILSEIEANDICVTGGEPFDYDLGPLLDLAKDHGKEVHIETSGTKPIPEEVGELAWVTCSPKLGFLEGNRSLISEWKFVVSADRDPQLQAAELVSFIGPERDALLFLQPVNPVESVSPEGVLHIQKVARAMMKLGVCPHLGVQLHKVLKIR
jgi:organic radical activating enzyme